MTSSNFHIQLYCVEGDLVATGLQVSYNGADLARAEAPSRLSFFAKSFEQVFETLLKYPGVYAEWDGSWSWTASEKNERGLPVWRIEGMIYDRDSRVFYVDMQGNCTNEIWRTLLAALQPPERCSVAICLTTLGVWVDRESFESWIKSTSNSSILGN